METCFQFKCKIEKGTPPHESGGLQLPVFEGIIPFWGILKSHEVAILRDGRQVFDIATQTVGVKRNQIGRYILKFQTNDHTVKSIVDHEYEIDAVFNFDDSLAGG